MTGSEIREAWERAHPPSSQIWKHALAERGYRELTDTEAVHRAARTLPSQSEPEGSVWFTEPGWVTVFGPTSDGGLRIYCTVCKSKPSGWKFYGKGWVGFEDTMRFLAARPRSEPRSAPRGDPMEIHY